jgi:hypothetical protein
VLFLEHAPPPAVQVTVVHVADDVVELPGGRPRRGGQGLAGLLPHHGGSLVLVGTHLALGGLPHLDGGEGGGKGRDPDGDLHAAPEGRVKRLRDRQAVADALGAEAERSLLIVCWGERETPVPGGERAGDLRAVCSEEHHEAGAHRRSRDAVGDLSADGLRRAGGWDAH